MKCEWCSGDFPHRKGRFCGTCKKPVKPSLKCAYGDEREHDLTCTKWGGCKFGGDSGMM